jgi:hypothetical protein
VRYDGPAPKSRIANVILCLVYILDVLYIFLGISLQLLAGWLYFKDPLHDWDDFMDHEKTYHAKVICLCVGVYFLFSGFSGTQSVGTHRPVYNVCYMSSQLLLLIFEVWALLVMTEFVSKGGQHDEYHDLARDSGAGSAMAKSFRSFGLRFQSWNCDLVEDVDESERQDSGDSIGDSSSLSEALDLSGLSPEMLGSELDPEERLGALWGSIQAKSRRLASRTCTAKAELKCNTDKSKMRVKLVNDGCQPYSMQRAQTRFVSDCNDCLEHFYDDWIVNSSYMDRHGDDTDWKGLWQGDAGLTYCRCRARLISSTSNVLRTIIGFISVQVTHVICVIYLLKCTDAPDDEYEYSDDEGVEMATR